MKRPPQVWGLGVDVSVDRLHFDLHLSGSIGFAKVLQTTELNAIVDGRHWVAMMRALSPFFNACPTLSLLYARETATMHAFCLPFACPVACAASHLRAYWPLSCTHAGPAIARSKPCFTLSQQSDTHTHTHGRTERAS